MCELAGKQLLYWIEQTLAIKCTPQELCVTVAHPDDETIGCGGILQLLSGATIIHVTDGAHSSSALENGYVDSIAYGHARQQELMNAMSLIQFHGSSLLKIGLGDLEVYKHLEFLISRLLEIFKVRNTSIVITHAFEGGHPDHDAIAFAVSAACKLMPRRMFALEFPLYRRGISSRLYQTFDGYDKRSILKLVLTQTERQQKIRMLEMFRSQQAIIRNFSVDFEAFRLICFSQFSELPNNGEILYEQFNWGVRGDDVQTQIRKVSQCLNLDFRHQS
jgi:N-acetylglucosamine malate deacetylase 2